MSLIRRLRAECPTIFFWLVVWAVLIPICFVWESLTFGMQFFWFFLRFLLFVGVLHQICSMCIALRFCAKAAVWCRRIIRIGSLVWLASFLILLALIILGGQADDGAETAPFIVVLGAGLNELDEPSLVLRQRLDKACEIAAKNPDAVLVLCGGQGVRNNLTEAEAMRRYLNARGIADERLILEDTSHDTAQNLANAAALMREYSGEQTPKACLITCSFHMMRSKLLAQSNNIDVIAAPSRTRPQEFHYYFREYFSMLIYLIEQTGITIDTWKLNL